MIFQQNLKFLRKRKKLSQEEIAAALEITRSSVSAYEIGTSEPNFDNLIKFSNFFKIAIDKLLKVELEKVTEKVLVQLEQEYDTDIAGKHLRILPTIVDTNNKERIELVNKKAKAGYLAGYSDPDFIQELPTFDLPFIDTKNKKFRAFPVDGDSMPPVPSNSYIIGEYVQDWNEINSKQPYILITLNEGFVFKMAVNKIKEKGTLLLYSTNPIFIPYEINIKEVLEVWKFTCYVATKFN